MNYPIWAVPASGLLIAFIAIVHVFVSHFAVGGGLFLVLTERKARNENDAVLLDYVRRHSRFFILLTLVFGAVTGVGIWFTIGLVHPAATSSLINTFVWGWAIEWTFFLTEIAAALVYYYGWDRLTVRQHLAVGWIYFVSAWGSLVVINGILSYMLTPGDWLATRGFLDGFLNPTYWPTLVIRTLAACGLAGVYAIFTASWLADPDTRRKLVRYAAFGWVLPMAVGLPLCLLWYFAAASGAGIPVAEIFGAASARMTDLYRALFNAPTTGQPVAQRAHRIAVLAATVTALLTFTSLAIRERRGARVVAGVLMFAALCSVGASEWVREALRKPYVIGSHMFVNGLRLPPPDGSPASRLVADDSTRIDVVTAKGVLAVARYSNVPPAFAAGGELTVSQEMEAGREVFRLLCSQCHTTDGWLAIRPLVRGKSSDAIENLLTRLAVPQDATGHPATWSTPGVRLATWRARQMPPFAGTDAEERALAVYLAGLGGGSISPRVKPSTIDGAKIFEDNCSMCHGPQADFPMAPRAAGKSEQQLFEMTAHLPDFNPAMPPFEGSEEERHALARYLVQLAKEGK